MTKLTDELQIAYQQGVDSVKHQLQIATDSRGGSQWDDMTGYGSDWPDPMKDQESGTDPAEVFEQLELPLDLVRQLQINPQQLASLDMWPNLEGIGVTIPKDDSDYGEASGPNKEWLERKGWSNLPQGLQINSDIAGALLPGETPAGGKGGLGSMNKDQLERWIKENGITGPGADKIRNKWKNLGPNLPLADASALTDLLSPHQNPRSGSLRGMPDKDRKELLIRGVAAHKA